MQNPNPQHSIPKLFWPVQMSQTLIQLQNNLSLRFALPKTAFLLDPHLQVQDLAASVTEQAMRVHLALGLSG